MDDPTLFAADVLMRQSLRYLNQRAEFSPERERRFLLGYPDPPAEPARVAFWRRLFPARARLVASPCC